MGTHSFISSLSKQGLLIGSVSRPHRSIWALLRAATGNLSCQGPEKQFSVSREPTRMDKSYGCPGNAAVVEKGPQKQPWLSPAYLISSYVQEPQGLDKPDW